MNKVLVEIFIPATGTSFDVYLPIKLPMFKILSYINKSVIELTEGKFIPVSDSVFCDKETGMPLDVNMSAQELCLHNGSCLMLI